MLIGILLNAPIAIHEIAAPVSNKHLQEYPELILIVRRIQGLGVDLDCTSFSSKTSSVINLKHVILISSSILLHSWGFSSWIHGVCL
jgi:hypothetical protein